MNLTTSPPPSRPATTLPAATAAAPGRRLLGRQPSLPGGRAIVGGLLVAVAAVGTFAVATSAASGPRQPLVVTNASLRSGQTLHANDVRVVLVDLPDDVRATTYASADELDGAVVLAPVGPDEPISRAQVRAPTEPADEPTARELSFALDRDHALDGRVQRGEVIDVVATYGSGADAYTTVVARGVRVLDVDAGGSSTVGSTSKVTLTIALAHEADVLEATHALEVAKVNVVRAAPGGADDGTDLRYTAPDPRAPGTTPSRRGGAG